MKSASSAKSADEIKSWEQADAALRLYAEFSASLAKTRAKMDAEILGITEKYADVIGNAETALTALDSQLKAFALEHKAEFKAAPDGDGRSYEQAGIAMGFRKLLDKVALPRGDARKQVALEYLAQYRPEFVRSNPEFDLVALLAALKDGDAALVKALAERAAIVLKPGRDSFFIKTSGGGK